jgi:hypothetical protein
LRTNHWSHRSQWDSLSIFLAAPGARQHGVRYRVYVCGCLPYSSFAN